MEGDACRPFGFYGMGEAAGDMVVVAVVRRARTQWLRRDGGLEGHCDTGSQFACDFIPEVTVVSYHEKPVALKANAEWTGREAEGAGVSWSAFYQKSTWARTCSECPRAGSGAV